MKRRWVYHSTMYGKGEEYYMKNNKATIFNVILDTFENEDIKELAKQMIDDIPDYFFDIGASSTGKYHPQYALGDLGLARHTVALCKFMNHMFTIEQNKVKFTPRERDILRLAGIMHDSRKSGEADNKSRFTVFDHPILAANAMRKFKGVVPTVTDEEIEMGAKACECHMGEWSTDKRSSVVLPKPSDKYGELLHLCDYLASRKDIEVLFDNVPSANVEVKLEDYKFTFGKYKGQLITEVAKEHKDYLEWMKGNMKMQEPLNTFVNKLLA